MAAERKRGCGFRKINGLYLCADGPGEPCHRLPIPLEVCPVCHGGIKQTRGWTWVNPELLGGVVCIIGFDDDPGHCVHCPTCNPKLLGERAGLIWIGERFYRAPGDFTREAEEMGVSRRITAIPKGFRVGEHWILVAHPKAAKGEKIYPAEFEGGRSLMTEVKIPGIFHVFKPSRIEKILADTATPEEIKEWEERGCKVVLLPAGDKDHQGSVYDEENEEEAANPPLI